jgi:hypothetical protein
MLDSCSPRPAFLRPLQLALSDWRERDGALHTPVK